MLPFNLVRYKIDGNRVRIIYVNPESKRYLKVAEDLINIYNEHLNSPKLVLTKSLSEYESTSTDYHIIRGLAKLLEDVSEFEIVSPVEPEVLREKAFEYSSNHHPVVSKKSQTCKTTREEALKHIASELEIEPYEVAKCLYADLEENRILTEIESPPSPRWLLDRYNVALAQAMLYKASEMQIRIFKNIPTKYKLVFQFIKLFRLMHVIKGNHAEGYHITLDGPASMFRFSRKYGFQMALFLPALLHCDRWWMKAKLIMNDKSDDLHFFKLTDEFGLRSHYKPPDEFDSKLERKFAEKFEKTDTEWKLEREADIINLKDTVMIPDFAFVHPDGRRAIMEIVGFWTPDYLRKKLWKLKRAGRTNMVMVVSENLNCSREDFEDIEGEVTFFKTAIIVKKVLDCVERCAIHEEIEPIDE